VPEPKQPETRTAEPAEQPDEAMPDQVPVLPTRGAVIYPYLVVPLFVGRPRSVQALEIAGKEGGRIALVAQRNIGVDDPSPDDLYTVGTIGEVVQTLPLPDGTIRVMIEGSARVRISGYVHFDPYMRARIEPLPEIEQPGIETEGWTEIREGQLDEGTDVVTMGQYMIEDGTRVTVQKEVE